MRPYLHLFITYKFQIVGTTKKQNSLSILRKKLHDFAKFNPLFGRQIVKVNKIFGKISGPVSFEYNDKHINFYKNENSYFDSEQENNVTQESRIFQENYYLYYPSDYDDDDENNN